MSCRINKCTHVYCECLHCGFFQGEFNLAYLDFVIYLSVNLFSLETISLVVVSNTFTFISEHYYNATFDCSVPTGGCQSPVDLHAQLAAAAS